MDRRAKKTVETIDVSIGIVLVFLVGFLAATITYEVTGQPALGWALTDLAFIAIGASLLLYRRRVVAAARRREG